MSCEGLEWGASRGDAFRVKIRAITCLRWSKIYLDRKRTPDVPRLIVLPFYSAVGAVMTPLPKNSLIVPNLSRLRCNASWNISCLSAESSWAFLKARILLFAPAHFGHSASPPSVSLRQF